MDYVVIGTFATMLGAFFVAMEWSFKANFVWLISNPILIWHNYSIGEIEQALMFSVLCTFCIIGIVKGLYRKKKGEKDNFAKLNTICVE